MRGWLRVKSPQAEFISVHVLGVGDTPTESHQDEDDDFDDDDSVDDEDDE